ncbi:MAG: hypothetical protein BroJett030_33370 [Alphaproteobacteria bacterium]|nr:MAG: hypothetical protein BroJett030_33370 [Alphaproteobacteria bacterium]
MNEKKRTYRLRQRARTQEETRRRIIEATMHLHEEIGPRATTISAIAERAGVQRLTVYRHFPDETAVFAACTAHWLSLNPPPDPALWAGLADPHRRLGAALQAFYRYYASTRRMWAAAHRDVAEVPALQRPMADFAAHVAAIADDLAGGIGAEAAAARVRATIGHVLAFPTWADLEARGLDHPRKVELALAWVAGAWTVGRRR